MIERARVAVGRDLLLALASLALVGAVRAEGLSDVQESATAYALQLTPYLLDDPAPLFFALPVQIPENGVHLRRRSAANDASLLLVVGSDSWSAVLASRNDELSRNTSTEQILGIVHRWGSAHLGVAVGTIAEGRRARVELPPRSTEIRLREDQLLVGLGFHAKGWDVDACTGALVDREYEDQLFPDVGYALRRSSDQELRPTVTVRAGTKRGTMDWRAYAGYRETTIEQSWVAGLSETEDRGHGRVYGHHVFGGTGGSWGIDEKTRVRSGLEFDGVRTPSFFVTPSSQTSERVDVTNALRFTVGAVRQLASARWGRPALLVSVSTRHEWLGRWQRRASDDPLTAEIRRFRTTAHWGVSAEKWGFEATASLSNRLLFRRTLARLDLSARF